MSQADNAEQPVQQDENHIIAERRAKLAKLRETSPGGVAFPNAIPTRYVLDLATQEEEEYMVVLAEMMDIDAGHISLASPLGRALSDKRVGDEVSTEEVLRWGWLATAAAVMVLLDRHLGPSFFLPAGLVVSDPAHQLGPAAGLGL